MALVGSLKGVVAETVAAVRTRLALFGLELGQARADLWRQGLQMIIGALLVFMALLLLTLVVILVAWDTPYRIWAAVWLAVFYGVIGVGLLWVAKRSISSEGAQPFAATIEELSRDADLLATWAQAKPSSAKAPERDKAESS